MTGLIAFLVFLGIPLAAMSFITVFFGAMICFTIIYCSVVLIWRKTTQGHWLVKDR